MKSPVIQSSPRIRHLRPGPARVVCGAWGGPRRGGSGKPPSAASGGWPRAPAGPAGRGALALLLALCLHAGPMAPPLHARERALHGGQGDNAGGGPARATAAQDAGSAQASPRGIGGLIGIDAAASLLTVTEGVDSDAIIAVARTGTALGAIGAGFATQAGSAGAGVDFGIRNGVVAFPSGDANPRFIVVPIVDDALPEGPEQFTVSLSQPTGGAALGPLTTVTVTILDDDVVPPVDPVFADGFED